MTILIEFWLLLSTAGAAPPREEKGAGATDGAAGGCLCHWRHQLPLLDFLLPRGETLPKFGVYKPPCDYD